MDAFPRTFRSSAIGGYRSDRDGYNEDYVWVSTLHIHIIYLLYFIGPKTLETCVGIGLIGRGSIRLRETVVLSAMKLDAYTDIRFSELQCYVADGSAG